MNNSKLRIQILSVLAVAALAGGFVLYERGTISAWFAGNAKASNNTPKFAPPKLVELADGSFGLELSPEAIESLELKPKAANLAKGEVMLPPMIGTVNYDVDRLFSIKPRFAGEVSKLKTVDAQNEIIKNGSPFYKDCHRSIKFGDKVKQGDVLAVFWSRDIGEKKAALVDAIVNLRTSKESLERQNQLYKDAAISLAALKQSERQVQLDSNAAMTAERTLRMWKLPDPEIKAIKDEANTIHDQKLKRDVVQEVEKWARVEIKVPVFDSANLKRELTILEKNTNLGEMIDPANYSLPLFRIADLSRLQIWVHPPEEYLPILRKQMETGHRALKWKIRFQSESAKLEPLELAVEQISPSLEPNQHTPMLIGYLDNPTHKYLIGQFVTATIMVRPPENTVAIPTDAVNPINGQEFVFIENPEAKNQFLIRRVSVAQSLKNISFVRTELTPEQNQVNLDIKEGEYVLQGLKAGDRVVTRGVVELTAALEELRNTKKSPK